MEEASVQEELLQQVLEQQKSLKELSDMLAVEPSQELQQVLHWLQLAYERCHALCTSKCLALN